MLSTQGSQILPTRHQMNDTDKASHPHLGGNNDVWVKAPDTEGTGFNTGLSEPLELKALSSERPNFIHKTSTHSKERVTTGSTAAVLATNRVTQGVPCTYPICECM